MDMSQHKERPYRRDLPGIDCVKAASGIARSLGVVIGEERECLQRRDTATLLQIAQQKQGLLNQIEKLKPQLVQLGVSEAIDEEEGELVQAMSEFGQLMKLCADTNRVNREVVMLEMQHASEALELLRSILSMDDLSLYGASGIRTVSHEKRRLGSA